MNESQETEPVLVGIKLARVGTREVNLIPLVPFYALEALGSMFVLVIRRLVSKGGETVSEDVGSLAGPDWFDIERS